MLTFEGRLKMVFLKPELELEDLLNTGCGLHPPSFGVVGLGGAQDLAFLTALLLLARPLHLGNPYFEVSDDQKLVEFVYNNILSVYNGFFLKLNRTFFFNGQKKGLFLHAPLLRPHLYIAALTEHLLVTHIISLNLYDHVQK